MKIRLARIVALLAAPCLAQTASASSGRAYPSKPVRLLVAFSAGSGSNTIGRIYAGGLGDALSQQVIVEFGAYLRSEIEAWRKIARELKLSAD